MIQFSVKANITFLPLLTKCNYLNTRTVSNKIPVAILLIGMPCFHESERAICKKTVLHTANIPKKPLAKPAPAQAIAIK